MTLEQTVCFQYRQMIEAKIILGQVDFANIAIQAYKNYFMEMYEKHRISYDEAKFNNQYYQKYLSYCLALQGDIK
jgi:hypothetical protein